MEYQSEHHSLKCPKCNHGMEEANHDGVVVDRCSHCQGIWFDADEAHLLKNSEGSEALDTGNSGQGWKWDSHADIDCPRCGKQMEKTADPKQKHIWYEACPEHGMFMDAGEFTDFKYESILDCFRSLIKGNRESIAP